MAATYPIDTPEKSPAFLEYLPVEAATLLYVGTLAVVNAAGNLIPAADAASVIAAGIVQPNKDGSSGNTDNTAGAAGALGATVKRGCFVIANSTADPVVAADILKNVFIEDNQTVNHTGGTNHIVAGQFLGFENGDPTRCVVYIH